MAFGFNDLKDFNETLNSLANQTNISENSANERNIVLCYAIANLACSITLHAISQFNDVHDDLLDTLDALYAFRTKLYHNSKGEVYESTSSER